MPRNQTMRKLWVMGTPQVFFSNVTNPALTSWIY